MKTFLKILTVAGAVVLLFKAIQVLIDVMYEQSNRRYITVDDE